MSLQSFSDKVLKLMNNSLSFEDAVMHIIKDEFKNLVLNDSDIVTEVIQNPNNYLEIVDLVTKKDLSVPSEDLINELLYRYHNHDTVVRQFISDLNLNKSNALLPTK